MRSFLWSDSGTKNLGEYLALAKREPHTLCYRMYCSLGDNLLADKPAKQILLGSGKADNPPSRI